MPDHGRWTSNGGDPNLNDINRADRFIEALSADQPVYSTDPAEAELAFLLADWRDGVRNTPVSAVVTERDAAAALAAGAPRRPNRLSLAVIGSAAAAVLCAGGFGVAVYGASPGDGLYGMRTMIFGQQEATRDDQVVLAAQQELAQVQQLVDRGQWEQAQTKLAALSPTVQSVETVEQKHDLIEQYNALTYKVVEQDPAATLPPVGTPPPVLQPDSPLTLLPVPVVTQTTETTTTTGTTTTETATETTTPATTTPSSTPTSPTTSVSETPGSETTTPPSPTTTSPAAPAPTTQVPATQAPSTPVQTTTAPTTTVPTTTAPPRPPTTTVAPTSTAPTSAAPTTTTTVDATTSRQQAPTPPIVEIPQVQVPASQVPATPSAPRSTVVETPVTTTVIVPGRAG